MKILLINGSSGWGGTQEHLVDLADEVLRHGVAVHFLVRRDSGSETRFRELGIPVHTMPHHGLGDVRGVLGLAAILRRERFDIVSINREHDLIITIAALRLAFPFRRFGKVLVSYHHATTRRQVLLTSVDAIVCVSEYVRSKLLRRNPRRFSKATVLYNGIAVKGEPGTGKFCPNRERRVFTGRGFPIIGMVGEFYKNQAELLEAIPLVRQEFPSLTVALVGGDVGGERAVQLRERIEALGLEQQVVLVGRVPRSQISEVFYDLDLSVSTFRNEGFGLVHLESLAAGTPVVAYKEGGVVEILSEGPVGVLVDGGVQAFAAAVVGLLRNHGARHAMGVAGHALVVRKYSRGAMGCRYLEFYRDVLNQS